MPPATKSKTVTAAEITRNFGRWQDEAVSGPVMVTHHGRLRSVLISADQYRAFEAAPPAGQQPAATPSEVIALDHIRDGFLAFDRDLTITAVNRPAATFLGRTRLELQGARPFDMYPEYRGSLIYTRLRACLRTGVEDQFEARSVLHPSRMLRVRLFPYQTGAAALIENITDEVAIADQTARTHAVEDVMACSSACSFIDVNIRGAIIGIGEVLLRRLSVRREALLDVKLEDLAVRSRRRELGRAIEKALDSRNTTVVQTELLSGGDEPVVAELCLAPIISGLGASGLFVLASFPLETQRG